MTGRIPLRPVQGLQDLLETLPDQLDGARLTVMLSKAVVPHDWTRLQRLGHCDQMLVDFDLVWQHIIIPGVKGVRGMSLPEKRRWI